MKYLLRILIVYFSVSALFMNPSYAYAASGGKDFVFGTIIHHVYDGKALPGTTLKDSFGKPLKCVVDPITREQNFVNCQEIAREMDMMKDAGIRMYREDMTWNIIEPQKGVFDWSDYDAVTQMASSKGLTQIGLLSYSNHWTGGLNTQQFRTDFANYAYQTVNKYKNHIKYWEVWNEETLTMFWSPGAPNPTDYGKLLIAAGQAIKAADPEAKVIFGGVHALDSQLDDPWEFVPKALAVTDYSWEFSPVTKQLTTNPVKAFDVVDIIAGHAYVDRGVGIPENYKGPLMPDYYKKLDNYLIATYGSGKRYWHTETGWTTSTGSFHVSEDMQANYIIRTYLLFLGSGLVDAFFQYDFRDDGDDPEYYEFNLGMIRRDFSPKQSYIAYQTMTRLLGNSIFVERLNLGSSFAFGYVFKDEARQNTIYALWAADTTITKTIPINADQATMITLLGEQSAANVQNKSVTLTLGPRPIYIVTGNLPPTLSPTPTSTSAIYGDITAPFGIVNIADYNLLLANFGNIGTHIAGDITQPSGRVDIYDYSLLIRNFGKSI